MCRKQKDKETFVCIAYYLYAQQREKKSLKKLITLNMIPTETGEQEIIIQNRSSITNYEGSKNNNGGQIRLQDQQCS